MLSITHWAALAGALCFQLQAQETAKAAPVAAPLNEVKGLPSRTSPAEYLSHAEAGNLTIAAEFVGHSVPTPEGIYESENYVVVEAAIFGPAQARANLAIGDFTLRINGRKPPLASQPYEVVLKSLKDPEWEPP